MDALDHLVDRLESDVRRLRRTLRKFRKFRRALERPAEVDVDELVRRFNEAAMKAKESDGHY